jgi:hypothetical protein
LIETRLGVSIGHRINKPPFRSVAVFVDTQTLVFEALSNASGLKPPIRLERGCRELYGASHR